MNTFKCTAILVAFAGLLLPGCSDEAQSPVTPIDQSAGVAQQLAKHSETPFDGLMWQDFTDPEFLVDPGVIKYPDGKMLIKGVKQKVVCAATFPAGTTDLFSGKAVVTMDGWADFNTGEGSFYGKLTVTPYNGGGGVWELSWHAKGTLGPLPTPVPGPIPGMFGTYGWTIPLQEEGPGKGGDLTGMHVFMLNTIYTTPDFKVWVGAYSGYVKSH